MQKLLQKFNKLPLGFGGAAISGEGGGYGFGDISQQDSQTLLQRALEAGIEVYDTAPIYGFGLSEKRIGDAFSKKRDEVFLISKSGVTWHSTKRVNMTNDPKVTAKMLEQSLKDLKSDYIDLYMIHWPDAKVDIRLPMEVLAKAKHQGKIKHIGLCNTYIEDIKKAQEIEEIEVIQGEYNFFETYNSELFPFLNTENISFMSFGTLDKGILSGRVHKTRTYDKSDCRSWAPWWKQQKKDNKYKFLESIVPTLKDHNLSMLEMALAYNLNCVAIDIILCGMKSPAQLESILTAIEKDHDQILIQNLKNDYDNNWQE